MGFARKGTTAVTPMISPQVSLLWCAGIISEDAVLTEIVAGKERLLNVTSLKEGLSSSSSSVEDSMEDVY